MNPFVRAAEVWLPSQDRTQLEFGAGLFGDAASFADASRTMRFGQGQGLPGDAWAQGRPILLKTFEGSSFMRTEAAAQAGLTCAVALPFFVAGELKAVLVLFGANDGDCTGALELWRNDPRISSDMTLVDGYYGGVPPAFEAISRDTYLPRGLGLPGLAWQREEFVVMPELGASTRFLRGEQASDAGISRGAALPCTTKGHASYVLTMLSGGNTSVTPRIERWVIDRSSESMQRAGGYCETQGSLEGIGASMAFGAWRQGVAAGLLSGRPVLLDELTEADGAMRVAAQACGTTSAVCMPVLVEDKVTEMAVLYL
jgi:hypothetical protein